MPDIAVARPDDYAYVFRTYRKWLNGVMYRSGVPAYMVEDAAAEVLLRCMAQDGLARFEGSLEEQPSRAKAYLATYFALGARAERSRALLAQQRCVSLDAEARMDEVDPLTKNIGGRASWHEVVVPPHVVDDEDDASDLLEDLLALSDDPDHAHIVLTADQTGHGSWEKTRDRLLAEGWDPKRVRAKIKVTRALVREFLCISR